MLPMGTVVATMCQGCGNVVNETDNTWGRAAAGATARLYPGWVRDRRDGRPPEEYDNR